jgi:hypothetical protein
MGEETVADPAQKPILESIGMMDQFDGNSSSLPQSNDGTPRAELGQAMRSALKMEKFAALGQKKLPVEGGFDPATEDPHTTQGRGTKTSEPGTTGTGSDVAFSSGWQPMSQLGLVRGEGTVGSTEEPRLASLSGQLTEAISERAFQLRQLGLGRMEVVLKPDSHTELALRLSLRDGVVEAHASVARGDFNALSSYWNELQHLLGHRGIQLAPLATAPAAAHAQMDLGAGAMNWLGQPGTGYGASQRDERNGISSKHLVPNQAPNSLEPRTTSPARRQAFSGWEVWA